MIELVTVRTAEAPLFRKDLLEQDVLFRMPTEAALALSNDQPITSPSEDRLGLDAFATAIASTILRMDAPSGIVLAVNGPWGSGKSSAINLIKHHLKQSTDQGDLIHVSFNPWWFEGPDVLTMAFFRELNAAIGPSLPKKMRKSLAAIGQGVSSAGTILGAIANMKAPGLGSVLAGVTGWIGQATSGKRTIDEEHRLLAEELIKQKRRFLVVVDDIDRLSPDDALTIFRLVKSVGRLPQVIYLLAFDRTVAERIVADRFPSEGASYLDKIIQGAFEIPPPLQDELRQQAMDAAISVMGQPPDSHEVRFWNVFFDVVAPTIRTPRDVARLANHISTTWPAIAGNVDRADFFALAALQIAEPKIYDAIRQHPSELCGLAPRDGGRRDDMSGQYDEILAIADKPAGERARLRIALRRLFPRLDSIWGRMWHSNAEALRRDRLLASPEHFRSYFAFSVSQDTLPADRISELIDRADDSKFVESSFRQALSQRRRSGTTFVQLLLEEIAVHSNDIDTAKIPTLIAALFAIADELDVECDEGRGFKIGDNNLRIHWFLNSVMENAANLTDRDKIFEQAMFHAGPMWACSFAERCLKEHKKDAGSGPSREPFVSEAMAERFREEVPRKILDAAEDGSLWRLRRPQLPLFAWLRLYPDAQSEIRDCTLKALADDAIVLAMAKAIPTTSWTHGMGFDEMGDRVSRQSESVRLDGYSRILDVVRFEIRIQEIIDAGTLTDEDLAVLVAFQKLPRQQFD